MVTEFEVFRYFMKHPKIYNKFSSVVQGLNLEFYNPAIKNYWDWIAYYHGKYNNVPSWSWLQWATESHNQLSETNKKYLCEALEYLHQTEDINYDQVFGFFLEKEHYILQEKISKADWENYDELLDNTKKRIEFLDTIRNPDKINNYVDETFMPLSKEYIEKSWDWIHEIKSSCITTGHDMLDFMLGGGFQIGTINCLHAKSNGGKTLVLGDHCMSLAKVSKTKLIRTVLFAMDINSKPMVVRLHANIGKIPLNNDYNKDIYTHRLMMGCQYAYEDMFWIVRWPRGQRTVKDIIEKIEEIEAICRPLDIARGIDPEEAGKVNVGWLDSINNIKHKVNKYNPEKRHQYDNSILDLAAYSETRQMVLNFTAQSNRQGNYVENNSDEFLGEHHGIRHHCNVLITLQRNKQDKINQKIRLAMNKSKAGDDEYIMHFHYNKQEMSISFDPGGGITYEDGTPHPAWIKLNPESAYGKIQSGSQNGIAKIQPKQRKKIKGINGSYTLPKLPFG